MDRLTIQEVTYIRPVAEEKQGKEEYWKKRSPKKEKKKINKTERKSEQGIIDIYA